MAPGQQATRRQATRRQATRRQATRQQATRQQATRTGYALLGLLSFGRRRTGYELHRLILDEERRVLPVLEQHLGESELDDIGRAMHEV